MRRRNAEFRFLIADLRNIEDVGNLADRKSRDTTTESRSQFLHRIQLVETI